MLGCRKNKMAPFEGRYIGTEHYYKVDYSGDTLDHELYEEIVNLSYVNRSYFLLTKTRYPQVIQVPSKNIVKGDTSEVKKDLIYVDVWRIFAENDSLFGSFLERKTLAGYSEYYLFAGRRE